MRGRRLIPAQWWPRIVSGIAAAVIVGVGVVVGALAAGYRPVVIQTGSMGDTAPPRSLIVAAPRDAADVVRGDIVVMRRPGSTPVTHRVIEIEQQASNRFAITQGDANEAPDAAPYPLEGEQLVARWIVPGLGGHIQTIFQPGIALAVVALATLVIAAQALRRIWAPQVQAMPAGTLAAALPTPPPTPAMRRRRRMAVAAVPLTAVMSAGVAWALFSSSEVVASNVFATAQCFDPQLTSVQSGESIHAVNGTVSVPLTPVDPSGTFVMASIRSSANEPADSVVQASLTGGGTALDLIRFTDNGVPTPVTVAWSVVEYGCGVDVQRGTVNGDGTNQVDVTISAVDTAASFVLVSSAPEGTATDFDADDLFVGELTSPTNLSIRTTGGVFSTQRSFAWQVVSFADPADVVVQTVSGSLGLGVAADSLTLGSPADSSTTFLLTNVLATSTGPDVGERLVRAHLADANTVAISRQVSGDPVDVQIQVVTLRDGSTVRHGTVDFVPGVPARTVNFDPVDPARSTAISTVAVPGLSGGGSTDQVADDVIGEASATFTLTDPETVTITRDVTASNASFGWQVIEWAGPRWWDNDYAFRQRIDVDTASAAAPGSYTVPLTFDHDALVSSELSLASGNDIRVVRWDGSSWTELHRVLDDAAAWNEVNTTLLFRTIDPIGANSTSSYWLYFGNDAPAAVADDPEFVHLLVEDFESGTLGDFEDRTGGTGWYSAAPWTRRIPVTVPSGTVAANLPDFPLLVSLTSADLAANAQADGSDIRFTSADGVTPLPHEIERWNSGSGELAAWVRVPSVAAAAPTTVYLYYGATDAPDMQDVRATWPDEIEAAWHLGRDPSGTAPQVDDSTARNHDGLSGGGMTATDLVRGRIGAGIDFDGTDDRLRVGRLDLGGANELTLSTWVRLTAFTNEPRLVAKSADATSSVFELSITNANEARARLALDGATVETISSPGQFTVGTWHHVVGTWDGVSLRIFVDGTEVGTAPAVGTLGSAPAVPVTIGNVATGDRPFSGRLDEVRVETVARDTAWIAALELNQRDPATFLGVGGVESGTWFAQGPWLHRKPIAVDADLIQADVSEFALLVQVTDAELQAGALATGADIVFTDADGVSRLDHVVESYDSGTGSLSAWVLVPNLSSVNDTQLFVYYGNGSAADQQDPIAVFGPSADLSLLGGS